MSRKQKLFTVTIPFLIVFCFPTEALFAGEGSLTIAPPNPEFTEYLEQIQTGKPLRLLSDEGHAFGLIPSPVDLSHTRGLSAISEFRILSYDPYYDLRVLNRVTPVKDQGSCGSCWAFATYGSLESWLKGEGETRDLSEQNLKNTHGFSYGHCSGGNHFMSTAYLARWSGPVSEADDPYDPSSGYSPPGLTVRKHLEEVFMIPDKNTDAIKQAVIDYGAVYTSMYYRSASYDLSDYTYYYKGAPKASNHAVAIVGWDDTRDTAANKDGAWIVKNSWGDDWGDGGYFYVSYYDSNITTSNASFRNAYEPTNSNNYQYDPLGWISDAGYSSNTGWGANIFTAAADEMFTAVGFYAATVNTSYEVYIYDNFNGSSFFGLLESKSGTLTCPGYHTLHLDPAVQLTEGDDFGIVVKFTTPGYNYPIPFEFPYPGYADAASSNPGESYVSPDGSTFTDITSHGGDFSEANVCIKGIARRAAHILSGMVTFEYPGWVEETAAVMYQVREPGLPPTGPLYEDTVTVSMATGNPATGSFTISGVIDGTYDLALKNNNHAADMVPGVVVAGSDVTGLELTLWAGDADGDDNVNTVYPDDSEGDNDVELSDYYTLYYQYVGALPATTGCNADFNADGSIDLEDYYGLYYGYQNNSDPGNWY